MSSPLVSVIVPAYNTAHTLPRCLDSVLAQTMEDLEIIVVDDGSPDKVSDVASSYNAKDPRVRLIRQRNQGVGTARNRGLQEAQGQYLSFVDSDDFIEPNMFQLMLSAAEETNAPVVNCEAFLDTYHASGDLNRSTILPLLSDSTCMNGTDAADYFLALVPPVLTSMGLKLVRRSAFSESTLTFPTEDRFGEDMVVSAAVILASPMIAFVHQPLYHYVRSDSLRTTSFSLKKAYDLLADMNQIIENAEIAGRTRYADAFKLEMLFSATRQIAWSNTCNTSEAKKLLADMKTLRPSSKPNINTISIPLMQRIKMDSVHAGWAFLACRIAYRLRWIPFIKYMM